METILTSALELALPQKTSPLKFRNLLMKNQSNENDRWRAIFLELAFPIDESKEP
jgi:hypothetical protein